MLIILCETIINQVDYSNKNHSNVDEIHVRNIDEDETKNVYNDLQIDVDTRDERMIYVDDDQKTQKRYHEKVSIHTKSITQNSNENLQSYRDENVENEIVCFFNKFTHEKDDDQDYDSNELQNVAQRNREND